MRQNVSADLYLVRVQVENILKYDDSFARTQLRQTATFLVLLAKWVLVLRSLMTVLPISQNEQFLLDDTLLF